MIALLNMFLSWIIPPKANVPANSKEACETHVYQLELKKMKLLPYADYVRTNMFQGKGKRKATEASDESSPPKKLAANKHSVESLTDDDTMLI